MGNGVSSSSASSAKDANDFEGETNHDIVNNDIDTTDGTDDSHDRINFIPKKDPSQSSDTRSKYFGSIRRSRQSSRGATATSSSSFRTSPGAMSLSRSSLGSVPLVDMGERLKSLEKILNSDAIIDEEQTTHPDTKVSDHTEHVPEHVAKGDGVKSHAWHEHQDESDVQHVVSPNTNPQAPSWATTTKIQYLSARARDVEANVENENLVSPECTQDIPLKVHQLYSMRKRLSSQQSKRGATGTTTTTIEAMKNGVWTTKTTTTSTPPTTTPPTTSTTPTTVHALSTKPSTSLLQSERILGQDLLYRFPIMITIVPTRGITIDNAMVDRIVVNTSNHIYTTSLQAHGIENVISVEINNTQTYFFVVTKVVCGPKLVDAALWQPSQRCSDTQLLNWKRSIVVDVLFGSWSLLQLQQDVVINVTREMVQLTNTASQSPAVIVGWMEYLLSALRKADTKSETTQEPNPVVHESEAVATCGYNVGVLAYYLFTNDVVDNTHNAKDTRKSILRISLGLEHEELECDLRSFLLLTLVDVGCVDFNDLLREPFVTDDVRDRTSDLQTIRTWDERPSTQEMQKQKQEQKQKSDQSQVDSSQSEEQAHLDAHSSTTTLIDECVDDVGDVANNNDGNDNENDNDDVNEVDDNSDNGDNDPNNINNNINNNNNNNNNNNTNNHNTNYTNYTNTKNNNNNDDDNVSILTTNSTTDVVDDSVTDDIGIPNASVTTKRVNHVLNPTSTVDINDILTTSEDGTTHPQHKAHAANVPPHLDVGVGVDIEVDVAGDVGVGDDVGVGVGDGVGIDDGVGGEDDDDAITVEETKVSQAEAVKRRWKKVSNQSKTGKIEFDNDIYVTKFDATESELLKGLCGSMSDSKRLFNYIDYIESGKISKRLFMEWLAMHYPLLNHALGVHRAFEFVGAKQWLVPHVFGGCLYYLYFHVKFDFIFRQTGRDQTTLMSYEEFDRELEWTSIVMPTTKSFRQFNSIDTNNDGAISFREWVEWLTNQRLPTDLRF